MIVHCYGCPIVELCQVRDARSSYYLQKGEIPDCVVGTLEEMHEKMLEVTKKCPLLWCHNNYRKGSELGENSE